MSGSYSYTRTTRVITSSGPGGQRTVTETHYGGTDGMHEANGSPGRIISRKAPLQQSRFTKGWGTRRPVAGPPMSLEGKTFAEIKAQCLREGKLFEDPDFHAVDTSIFYSRAPPRPFVWKRPPDLCSNPKLFVDGASRFDVKQGELGDCWLLAAVASLCQYKDLLYRVVPQDQGFDDGEYCGCFHFQFWRFGEWKDVIIDDRLPTYYDRLVFMHSDDMNEFWTPLLEKAYAKLVGSYEALKGGATSEAMEDFTGGMTETFDFRQNVPANLFHIMLKAKERNSLMGCSIEAVPGTVEAELPNGLICGHAYSVTGVSLIDIQTSRMKGKIPMIRVRNPWGNEAEWKGAWSDKSPEWKFISDEQRREIGLTFDDDGEFWMSFQDFSTNFQKLEVCHMGPDAQDMSGGSDKKRWETTVLQGSWRKRVNAGGCRNFLDTFWTNPQYRVEVVDPDEDDDDNMGTIIVALMQKNRRTMRKEGKDLLTMGYCIYKLKDPSCGPLDMRFFKYNASVAKSPAFINLREVCGRHKLPPGHYCIMPSTFEPNQEGDFLLRIFSEKPNISGELDEETEMADVQIIRRRKKGDSNNNAENGHTERLKRIIIDHDDYHPIIKKKHGFLFPNFRHIPRHLPRFFSNMYEDMKYEVPAFFAKIQGKEYQEHEYDVEATPVNEPILTAVHVSKTGESTVVNITPPPAPPEEEEEPEPETTDADAKQDESMREAFKKISGDDLEIDAYELQDILNAAFLKEFKFDGFSAETCRSMVAMMDIDRSGKLGFDEFKKLWNDLRLWKGVFKQYDKDKSGYFSSFELRQAFHACGFKLSNSTFNALVQRYSHRDGHIYFDDMIHCVVRLKTMFEIFKEQDEQKTGKASFSLDEFIQTTMYS